MKKKTKTMRARRTPKVTRTDSPTASTARESRGKTVPPADDGDRIVGSAGRGEIEVRYDNAARLVLDEICANDADVHLEMMGDSEYALIIETQHERACFFIGAVNERSHVRACESWRSPINRRAEAARRRENMKRGRRDAS